MPVSYYEQLKLQLTEAATAKKAALDAAYDRATTATFDASGNASYKKDASGNNIYGTRDVQYMEQKRNINTGAESSGTLRSGQNQRNLINSEAAYRSDIGAAAANLTTQKNIIDTETATKGAEYKAMYDDGKGSTGASSNTPKSNKKEPEPAAAPAANVPKVSGPFLSPAQRAAAEAAANKKTTGTGSSRNSLTPAQAAAWKAALESNKRSRQASGGK